MQEQIEQQWGLSVGQKAEMWARWKVGESLSAIARAFGKPAGSIFGLLAMQGGIVRAPRRRARHAVTFSEREPISRWLGRAAVDPGDRTRARATGIDDQP